MASIGEMLRQAREAQGRSVADLAMELCITERYLRALEQDDVKTLPGVFFYQSFVRQYGAIVGLDVTKINEVLAPPNPAPEAEEAASNAPSGFPSYRTNISVPQPSNRLMEIVHEIRNRRLFSASPAGLSTASLVAAVVLGTGIFAWWTRTPQAPAANAANPSAAKTTQTRAAAQPNAVSPNASASGSSAAVLENTVATSPDAAPPDVNQVVLSLSATEKTWISITSHGKVIFSGVLQPSQSKTLMGGEVATLKIGNAGGVDIEWNGKSIGPIGPRGQVRTVRFTRQDFHVLSPADLEPSQSARDDL